jgi:hypothetical protein
MDMRASPFEKHHFDHEPRPRTLILSITSFSIVGIMGFDPKKLRFGDIVVNIVHSKFFKRTVVLLKVGNDGLQLTQLVTREMTCILVGPTHIEYL